ncbi:MAG: Fe-S cluster assembly protein SufD [Terriglobia bacterium]
MPEVKEVTETYFADFARLERETLAPAAWVQPLRKAAMERFAEAGFPTTRHEDWRFTNVAPVANASFKRALPGRDGLTLGHLNALLLKDVAARLVFVNGFFKPELSSLENVLAGVRVVNLATALETPAKHLEEHLARHAEISHNPFVALNTAFIQDGAFIQIAKGVALENPIHVVHVRTRGSAGTVTHPRTLIVAGHDVRVTVIESYAALSGEAYFTNAVTEVVAGENSAVEHIKLQEESENAFHIGTVEARQERSSRFYSHSISLGALLARHDINAILGGEGAECTLNGLFQTVGRQHVDHHTRLDHAMPHCSSREYYRGVLDGRSVGVFNGAIIVRKDAQKTDAIQSNKNLLLSDEAVINTKPELQILADDVRCTHGATIGQLDADAIFYLRARGIGLEAARHLLTRAFANDVINRIKFAPARERLEGKLLQRLSAGWKPEEVL